MLFILWNWLTENEIESTVFIISFFKMYRCNFNKEGKLKNLLKSRKQLYKLKCLVIIITCESRK
jgi:hypothetical protein